MYTEQQILTDCPADAKRLARQIAKTHVNAPVEVVAGNQVPVEAGESYYFTTPSGKTRVAYPNAYKWATVYHHSTLRVVVGAGWIAKRYGYWR